MSKKAGKSAGPPPGVRCPVCGGEGTYHGKPNKSGLAECEGCRLLFMGDPPPREDLTARRESRFAGAWTADNSKEARADGEKALEAMVGFFFHTEGKPAARNAFGRNVLDVGCGLGFRLRRFQDHGWNPYGIDPSDTAVEIARASSLEAQKGWFDATERFPDRFDLVMFHGTLGCLPEPLEAVRKLDGILRPRGLVFVNLAGEPVSDHLFSFEGETLRRLFMENGFTALEEGEGEGGAFAWFCRKSDRRKPKAAMAEAVLTADKEV